MQGKIMDKSNYENLLSDNVIEELKVIRTQRLNNLQQIINQMDYICQNLKRKKSMQDIVKSTPESIIKRKSKEILIQTMMKLNEKVERNLPIDDEDVDFALKIV
jgi:hypothetical protein